MWSQAYAVESLNLSLPVSIGDLLINPDQPKSTIPIAQIAPDLILADLPRNIMLNNDELEFYQTPEFLLGNTVFALVNRCFCQSFMFI